MLSFFRKRPTDWLSRYNPQEVRWLVCTVSNVHYLDLLPNVRLEMHGSKVLKAAWGLGERTGRWDIWEGEKHLAGKVDTVFAPFFLYTHVAFEAALSNLKASALIPVAGMTTSDLTQEGKALEWLKGTLRVLANALESCERDHSKLVQASFFIGEKEAGALPLFRAVVFNLDITAAFDQDGALGVVVFDDKNDQTGSTKNPSLEARFRALKPAVLDEFIRLTHACMKAVESRYTPS